MVWVQSVLPLPSFCRPPLCRHFLNSNSLQNWHNCPLIASGFTMIIKNILSAAVWKALIAISCNLCRKTFRSDDSLRTQKRSKQLLFPIKCPLLGDKLHQMSCLLTHSWKYLESRERCCVKLWEAPASCFLSCLHNTQISAPHSSFSLNQLSWVERHICVVEFRMELTVLSQSAQLSPGCISETPISVLLSSGWSWPFSPTQWSGPTRKHLPGAAHLTS